MEISRVDGLIHVVRGQKVILDADLARLYMVETKQLNRAVRRNSDRFPADFMFELSRAEAAVLRCQIGTSKKGRGGRRYLPQAFTEHGVAMLSSVNSADRELYARTKRELARKEWKFVQDYADAKTAVVQEILTRALG